MRLSLLALLIVGLGVVAWLLLSGPPFPSVTKDATNPDRATIERAFALMQCTLLDSVRGVALQEIAWQDTVLRLKCELPAQRLPEFLAGSPFKNATLSSTWRHVTSDSQAPSWWVPDRCSKYLSGTVSPADQNEAFRILIDQDNPETVVIYLVRLGL